jgi:dTMP kinase
VKEKFAGKFIVLDGPDGCGKSTQARLLAQRLRSQGIEVVELRDPGATAIGEKIRAILLNPEHAAMCTRTELLLYMAARAQLWKEKIAPALAGGKCVILDRWLSSTCAYQGCAGGFGIEKVIKLAEQCLERVWPDMTIILDVDARTASTRLKAQLDRMEQKGKEYHRNVREGFIGLAQMQTGFCVVDASGGIEAVETKVIETLRAGGFDIDVY